MKKLTENRQSGFSLLELLVIVVIMVILGSVMIANFRQGERQKRVNLARDTVISAIRFAQNQTLAGKQIQRDTSVTVVRGTRCATDNSVKSYWAEFDNTNTITIMAEDTCNAVMSTTSYTLPNRTKFAGSNPFQGQNTSGAFSSSTVATRFVAPFASITLSSTASPLGSNFTKADWIRFSIQSDDLVVTKTVLFDAISGNIQIE
ncbi:MAG: prepilin-type N-terminal cleavage/methylation domain-containing protein [Candidatus Doudnabacteria bacterium]|nr:prepilin-type N-terminal cleavage/methylation domain-containing protein [Candidatus Doudnabacteria bacterium]